MTRCMTVLAFSATTAGASYEGAARTGAEKAGAAGTGDPDIIAFTRAITSLGFSYCILSEDVAAT